MPVRGRPPKDDGAKVNRVPMQHQWTDVEDKPFVPPNGYKTCPVQGAPAATRRWWAAISTMPHCVLWGAGEWAFAEMTAVLHAKAITSGQGGKEVRDRERVMGTTDDARRALRIRYKTPGTEPQPVLAATEDEEREEPPAPIDLDERRRMLGA